MREEAKWQAQEAGKKYSNRYMRKEVLQRRAEREGSWAFLEEWNKKAREENEARKFERQVERCQKDVEAFKSGTEDSK